MPNFTPTTKRLLVIGISLLGLTVTIGWVLGSIQSKDALVIIVSIISGFLALLKGVE